MTDTATAYWFQAATGEGRDITFESVENAVRFVMEELSEQDRTTAFIRSNGDTMHFDDIKTRYDASSAPGA